MEQYNAKIASIPVDNTARHVAGLVANKLEEKHPGMKVVVTCNPAHCVDLLMKDLAKTSAMQRVIHNAKIAQDFVKVDCIDSICRKAAQVENLVFHSAVFTPVDTCMNLLHDVVKSA